MSQAVKMNANDLYLLTRIVEANEDGTKVFAKPGEAAACRRLEEAGYIIVDHSQNNRPIRVTRKGETIFILLVDLLEWARHEL